MTNNDQLPKTNYENVKIWRKNNPDKLSEQKKRYRTKNKEKINSYWKEWYAKKQEQTKLES